MAKLILVEDEPEIRSLLTDYLASSGYQVTAEASGDNLLEMIRNIGPDLILLDIMLPGNDGLELCREIRAESKVPIIFITARHEEVDRILGLRLGADDYICKPFSPREVIARVEALLRRQKWQAETESGKASGNAVHTVRSLVVDADAFIASWEGQLIDLTPVELRLLATLSDNPGRAFRRSELIDRAYDDHRVIGDRTVDSHMKNLRAKLTAAGVPETLIESVYGVGYRLKSQH